MVEDGQTSVAVEPVEPVTAPVVDPVVEPVVEPTEPVAPVLTGTPTPVEPVPVADIPIVDSKGVFSEKWIDSLNEDSEAAPMLAVFTDVQGLAKSYIRTKRLVGKDKIATPNEKSTDADWEAWHIAGGRPKTAEDYNFTRPETLPEELYNQDFATEAQKLFFQLGLSEKQSQGIFQFHNDATLLAAENEKNTREMAVQQAKEGLEKDWGQAYTQNVQNGNLALDKGTGGDKELLYNLTEKFGADPDFIRLMSSLGGQFAEHGAVLTAKIETPADLSQKIAEARGRAAYEDKAHPEHEATVAFVESLYKERAKSRIAS